MDIPQAGTIMPAIGVITGTFWEMMVLCLFRRERNNNSKKSLSFKLCPWGVLSVKPDLFYILK